ncbi:MAG: A24 family peptidase [Bdellovibrionota bacterium]|nr:A24 family peptidase [Bdellovibrionota bacterium]
MEQFLVGSLLAASVASDLRTRKVRNYLILGFLVLSLGYFTAVTHFSIYQLQNIAIVCAACLPLVYLRALGAGDFKLLLVVCMFLNPTQLYSLLFLSLFWNAVSGSLKFFVNKITKSQTNKEALRFPFTFGILLAWFSLDYIPKGLFPW